jgi:hypothetical protein
VRLQLRADTERFYSVNKPAGKVVDCNNAAAGDCISSAVVARRIIRNFFE